MLKRFIYICCFSFFLFEGNAQDNTLFFNPSIPQTLSLNPARQYQCRMFINVPVLSSIKFAYNNSGFGYNNLIRPGGGALGDSLIFDVDGLYSSLRKINLIRNDINISILGFGMRVDRFYFTLNIDNITETNISFPRDILAFRDGNWNFASNTPRPIDLTGLGVNATNYTAIALGASYSVNNRLNVGLRLKYLLGAGNITSAKNQVEVITKNKPLTVDINTDILFNSSFPINIEQDALGTVTGAAMNIGNPIAAFLLNSNKGYSADLGVQYRVTPQLLVEGSIVDLGYIKWKSNVNSFFTNGNFTFSGIDLDRYSESGGQIDFVGELKDSIKNAFKFGAGSETYKTFLSGKAYLGGKYQLIDQLQVGVLAKLQYFRQTVHPSVTLSVQAKPVDFLSATASYSYMNNSFTNLGFSLALGRKGFQFYFVTDNIPVAYTQLAGSVLRWPYNARTINFRFGFNLIFGCSKSKKGKQKAIPCRAYKSN